ncbi:helix-turn-helix transcriptional regulator [Streptomyces sp. NPDC055966]|uniref:helix-turn-helix transcriptional regulator n=1 Tax=Streptomyces sp. NPDC055966 TaxID=3345669 RepID=UPI0035DA9963
MCSRFCPSTVVRCSRRRCPRTCTRGRTGARARLRRSWPWRSRCRLARGAGIRCTGTLDEPGQDAVLDRLLDLVLVLALRTWCAGANTAPAWYRALADPAIRQAVGLLHEEHGRRWTVAELATHVGMSRAAFAARFPALVGEPPLAYLTGWRMTMAADLLRDGEVTVAAVAHEVGYEDPFAFSVAFKRA